MCDLNWLTVKHGAELILFILVIQIQIERAKVKGVLQHLYLFFHLKVVSVRALFYIMLMQTSHTAFKAQLEKMLDDRYLFFFTYKIFLSLQKL